MNHKEKNLSNRLKKYLQEEQFYVDKIESRLTTAGIPDMLVLSPHGQHRFLELKVVEDDNIISLTPGQKAWHSRCVNRNNSDTVFIVYVESKKATLVMRARTVLDIVLNKGGKLPIEDIPEHKWFKQTAVDYAMLIYTATELYFSSSRVYT